VTRPALPVVIGRRAVAQVEEVARWWAENRPGARDAVRQDLTKALGLIALQPECGTPAQNARLAGVRRIHLSRLNYFLYYRLARGRGRGLP
jgi:plasmid stabilization system protein ParE